MVDIPLRDKDMKNDKKKWVQTESEIKIVVKPWGSSKIAGSEGVGEMWLNYDFGEEVGEREKKYVFKKLYIKKGTRTSFQYHVHKFETNHLITGKAEAWMENNEGEIEKSLFEAGDTWTIPNGKKHRLIALTDLVMLEASTPEVDDVIRIDDDTDRGSGRIQSEHIK